MTEKFILWICFFIISSRVSACNYETESFGILIMAYMPLIAFLGVMKPYFGSQKPMTTFSILIQFECLQNILVRLTSKEKKKVYQVAIPLGKIHLIFGHCYKKNGIAALGNFQT